MSNMVVRTNIMSLNSHRNMGMTGTAQARASARLSSGFRINSAADDAAGLAISEKMRGQIRGLDQASRNAQDGISLIQTAEGAMQSINDMVIRIRELIIQAANDTNVHEEGREALSDRVQLQREIDQLLDEIDAVSLRTEFNTRVLLDGTWASDPLRGLDPAIVNTFLTTGAGATPPGIMDALTALTMAQEQLADAQAAVDQFNANRVLLQNFYAAANSIDQAAVIESIVGLVRALDDQLDPSLGSAQLLMTVATTLGLTEAHLAAGDADINAFITAAREGSLNATHFADISMAVDTARDVFVQRNFSTQLLGFESTAVGAGAAAVTTVAGDAAMSFQNAATAITAPSAHGVTAASTLMTLTDLLAAGGTYGATRASAHDLSIQMRTANVNMATAFADNLVATHAQIGTQFSTAADLLAAVDLVAAGQGGNALWFQIGANEGQGIRINIESVGTSALGIDGFRSGGAQSIEIEPGATIGDSGWITMLDEALAVVTGQRAILGAVQNRLEFTIENLDVASENLQAANSRIRDADMAREMMRLTQMNVLQQAAISMLAQANQAPQNILQLLR